MIMKKRMLPVLVCVFCATCAFCIDFLPVPNSQKGQVTFVNRQTRLAESEILAVCRAIEKATKCKAAVGSIDGAKVSVEVIDDASSPVMTAYPEDYRAVVNVGKLDKNLKGKALEKFYPSRCRKELLRAFCFACGAGGSQYPDNIMAIGDITDLDLCEEFIPGDTASTCETRLGRVGVTPTRYASYAKACRDGWAPQPTNDVQKAIWDKVHAMPTEPLKIKPEEKKVSK